MNGKNIMRYGSGVTKNFVILTTRFTNEFRKTLYKANLSKTTEQIKAQTGDGSNRKKFTTGTLLYCF